MGDTVELKNREFGNSQRLAGFQAQKKRGSRRMIIIGCNVSLKVENIGMSAHVSAVVGERTLQCLRTPK